MEMHTAVASDEFERTSFASLRCRVEEIKSTDGKDRFRPIAYIGVRAWTATDREKPYCIRGLCAVRRRPMRRRATKRRGSRIANHYRKTAWRIDDAPRRIVH
jgi:hypothetical protein